ncbi:hypothetical protein ACQW02_22690 [Humitalea sp. 24SJ18S-53]|uniref:hypothetical protein n=1 Tax=Humitalea sp. 24SJ18S-53 TaxID=3422307 RepID=UPI003D665AFF
MQTDGVSTVLYGVRPAPPADGGPALSEGTAAPVPSDASFDEILRSLNPLHHVPGVGMIYRAATGERVLPAFQILGATLTGGPVMGLATAAWLAVGALSTAQAATDRADPAGAAARYAAAAARPNYA